MQRSTKLEACTRLEEKLNAVAGTEGERKQVITGEIHVYGIEEERLIGGDRVIGAMGHLHGAVNKGMRVYLIPLPIPLPSQDVICLVQTREEGETWALERVHHARCQFSWRINLSNRFHRESSDGFDNGLMNGKKRAKNWYKTWIQGGWRIGVTGIE